MNRVVACVVRVLIVFSLSFASRVEASSRQTSQVAGTTTAACGVINSNITWSLTGSPYDVCASGVLVPPGVTLTVEPGVTVRFQSSAGNRLIIQGNLVAIGTPAQPITFTGVVTAPGSWGGILADGSNITPALVSLSYVNLRYGGVNATAGAQLYADSAVVTLTHGLVRDGAGSGLYFTPNAHFVVHSTSLISNGRDAIQVVQPVIDLDLSDLSASGNGTDGVRLFSTAYVHGQHRWSNPGIPYVVDGQIINQAGDGLDIDPGTELRFTSNGFLNIGGRFEAIGRPGQPITFTGVTRAPGAWRGLLVYGGAQLASAQLDYATLEYAGSDTNGAAVYVANGQVVARHSVIRYSQRDGLLLNYNGAISIQNSHIYSNTQYGIRNLQPGTAILATNNWWGDPSGPESDVAGCPAGTGDRVTTGVLFRPVLTSTAMTAEFPLSDAPIMTLAPQRWFVAADNRTRLYADITLRDGNGAPLPGRTVRLSSTIGKVVDGGITDVNGHTLAYVTSANTGDATLTAALDALTGCEGVVSPPAKVTFTPPVSVTEMFPNSRAPYLDDDIDVTPLPIVAGVTTTIKARLTNPLSVPVTVDVSFEFAQAGVGLAYGPINQINGQVIPANSSVVLGTSWMPPISGHYCIQVNYSITAVGTRRVLSPQEGGGGRQRNLNVYQSPTGSPNSKDSLNKADKAWNAVSHLTPDELSAQQSLLDAWWSWAKDSASKISQSLGFDPPSQDYHSIAQPQRLAWPQTQPGGGISAARAAALNAVSAALVDVNAYGTAAAISMDRYGGASEAHDLQWASLQASALDHYKQQMGAALATYAGNLDAFVQVLKDEGETSITVTVGAVISYQQRLKTQGLTQQEIAAAHQVGLSDADIAAYVQDVIATDPASVAGNVLTMYTNEAAVSRELSDALLHPYNFVPLISVGGSAGLLRAPLRANAAVSNTLAQIYAGTATVLFGNPLTQTATIDVRVRRIALPADWMVTASPAQVVLAPHQQTTVTVRIVPGAPVPQGIVPQLAVEGYVGNRFLGGVAIEVVVPNDAPFIGQARVSLPLLRR
jgi:hypothetical protein